MKIDAVITWVDGDDPAHKAKRMKYASSEVLGAADKAADTRFSDLGEIFWCVASLNRFAPWLNRIYIVTDAQDPGLDEFISSHFPTHIPMEIVDHKVIFRGYEQYLPVFNSISIETMTWRIPGLSDCFIEFNDDLMLLKPVSPEDFFTPDGRPVCYGSWSSIVLDRFTRLFKRKTGGQRMVTTKGSHMNGAARTGARFRYLRPAHCQKALRRDFYEAYFAEYPEDLLSNISYRFRDAEQFTPQVTQYMTLHQKGKCIVRPADKELFFFQPKEKEGYFEKKMRRLEEFEGHFACFNSIDLASESQRKELVGWVERKVDVRLHK